MDAVRVRALPGVKIRFWVCHISENVSHQSNNLRLRC